MTLPLSGPLSLGAVNTEIGVSSTSLISLNNTNVRATFNKPNSLTIISMSDGYGKSWIFNMTLSALDGYSLNLRAKAIEKGWDGIRPVVCTVNSPLYGNTALFPALTISGAFPNGVALINLSSITGFGGFGGGHGVNGANGGGGGIALSVSTVVSITNASGTIGGGGGGGGKGGSGDYYDYSGGGGGGASYAPKGTGNNGLGIPGLGADGSPGGLLTGGAGGAGSYSGGYGNDRYGYPGGAGGSLGVAGSNGQGAGGTGGPAGLAVNGNIWITWVSTGTRLGAIA